MSLIRIRGRTILAPILSEEERVEARALRDQAVQSQHERQRFQCQQQPQFRICPHQHESHRHTWGCETCSDSRNVLGGSEKSSSGFQTRSSTLASPSMTQGRQREGQENSSSSGPSSHGSGGEPMSEGPEDSPSAAHVSVQTESSVSLTASTDLRSYLNTSLDNSLDTSISASHDTWHQSSLLAEVDEALLMSASPEVATNLILGRLHPSAVLHPSTTKVRSSQADSQHTETASSTLVQGQQILEHHMPSENHDTTTTASLSLSFASASEEGGEGSGDGLDVSEEILEVSEAIDGSEEDQAGSLPSEVESDSHKEDNRGYNIRKRHVRSPKASIGDVGKIPRDVGMREGTSTGTREIRDGILRDVRDPSWMLQWDSGRSSSHSDYLDDYLELLTSKCNSGLGLEANVLSVTTCKGPLPVTSTTTATSRVISTSGSETSSGGNFSTSVAANTNGKQKDNKSENLEASHKKTAGQEKDSEKQETKEGTKEKRSPRELQRTRDMLAEPRSLSAASERRASKKSRARRWSSAQPLDPGRSVGSKYLDSYLGNLTDDAWLQYPTHLTSRRMVFLSSDEYILSVRPQAYKKAEEESSGTRKRSESSTSEESKRHDTSITSSDDPLSNAHDENTSSDDLSKSRSGKDKTVASKPHSTGENKLAASQSSQQPQQNLNLDGKSIPSATLPNESSRQSLEAMATSLGSQDVEENGLYEAPETPSDKTETKVSSDEGIEVLGSPASTGSGGKLVDDSLCVKTSSTTEVPVIHKEIKVIPPTPSDSVKGIVDPDRSEVESTAPAYKVLEVSGCAERSEEFQDSSSEDSSETEPSTIVYVDDCPTDSLSEGQKSSLNLNEIQKSSHMDSEVRNILQVDSRDQSIPPMKSKEQSNFQDNNREQNGCETQENIEDSDKDRVLVPHKFVSPHRDNKASELVEHQPLSVDVQLVRASEHIKGMRESGTKNDFEMCTQRPVDGQNKERVAEYDMYDSDDECLVVQVYEDKNTVSRGETSDLSRIERDESTESDQAEQVIKIVPQRRDKIKYDKDASCKVELVPYKSSENAMDHVLTLLRAKQQQELEELRLRQEEEVREFIRQLQCVSPEQLHAFLAASSATAPSSDGRVDGCLDVSHNVLKTKALVRPNIEKNDSKGGNKQEGSSVCTEAFKEPSQHGDSAETSEVVSSTNPTYRGQAREWGSRSGLSPTPTHSQAVMQSCASTYPSAITQSYSSMHSSAVTQSYSSTHPSAITQSCSSVQQPISSNLPLTTIPSGTSPPPTTSEKTRVESPKPRPSNHTNLMPSYIMNEEARKSSGNQENDNYLHLDASYQALGPKNLSPQMSNSPHHIPLSSTSVGDSERSNIEYSLSRNNNSNLESVDSVSFINGNCVNYGDGMQYYRLCTPDEDLSIDEITPRTTVAESHYQSKPTETVTQPGLFKVFGNTPWPSPRPTSITSLLAEHPEIFRDDIVEVNLDHPGDWGSSTVGLREPCRNVVEERSMVLQDAVTAEGGLDMVPEKESASSVHFHRLSQNVIFIKGIIRLQACIRRYMTQRLLRTKFVEEQLATLAEIAKLAQQFRRDILTDNIHKGDVDFHKALYNQEALARERIRRVFFVLSVEEQMSLIRRDRHLWQMDQDRQNAGVFRSSPTHTVSKYKNRNVEEKPRSVTATKVPAAKRPSPTGPRPQQDVKTRAGSLRSRATRLVQPSVTHHSSSSHTVHVPNVHADHKHSPRVSKLPVQMERSSSHVENAPPHYSKPSVHVKSPQDPRCGALQSNRCASHPRSSSASQLPTRSGSRQNSRTSSHVPSTPRSMSCTPRSTTHSNSPRRATPPKPASKTSIVGRRPWR
ncbi:serine-rich adhesin for platelets isoform X2 [Procambarus clarkii]|uniref:serine-rich adhesin for platelets isoform X2 n=1 Tax=Procambarus clarkii TaxID=6728 RepID=UPI001E674BF3|nr:uncharacterized protein LOC123754507 isoform X2 [Procambarus clarkii]